VIDAGDALSLDGIRRARAGIAPVFLDSPRHVHEGLSARLGIPVIVKVETINPIRSFKGRGTWFMLNALVREGRVGTHRALD
jgi:threonine dehydratase